MLKLLSLWAALKIIELLDNRSLRGEIGQYGRERIENELEWKYEVPILLAAYNLLWA